MASMASLRLASRLVEVERLLERRAVSLATARAMAVDGTCLTTSEVAVAGRRRGPWPACGAVASHDERVRLDLAASDARPVGHEAAQRVSVAGWQPGPRPRPRSRAVHRGCIERAIVSARST